VPANLIGLATLPLRLTLRGAELLLRAAGGIVGGHGHAAAEQFGDVATATPARPTEPAARPAETEPRAEPEPAPAPAPPARAVPPRDEPEDVPDHVSEEPVLVEEFADPGAENGAGPEIEVAEPWPSYGTMKADEVIARLEDTTPAAVAVARLYEQANRRRKTVLAAADRRLKALDA
jgi:hypothetical protein